LLLLCVWGFSIKLGGCLGFWFLCGGLGVGVGGFGVKGSL